MTTPHPLDPLSAEEIRTVTAVLARAAWRSAAVELVAPTQAGPSVAGSPDGA